MSLHPGLVLDANILLRAAFGNRVLNILQLHEDSIAFCCPDHCIEEALRNLPAIALRRGFDADVHPQFSTGFVELLSLLNSPPTRNSVNQRSIESLNAMPMIGR